MRESLTGGLALLAALLAAVTIVSIYVSNEHDFYTSDYRGYESITHRVVASLQQSPRTAVVIVASSMRDDYNALFTLPLVPFVLVFGESRLLYETALTVAYALPLGLVVGGVGVRLIRAPARPVFWSTVALTQLLPMAWVPSLRGYGASPSAVSSALQCSSVGTSPMTPLPSWRHWHFTRWPESPRPGTPASALPARDAPACWPRWPDCGRALPGYAHRGDRLPWLRAR